MKKNNKEQYCRSLKKSKESKRTFSSNAEDNKISCRISEKKIEVNGLK